MTITSEVQGTVLDAAVELFILDLTNTGSSTTKTYFQPSSVDNIVFNGNTYIFIPVSIEGVSISTDDQPAPTLTVANTDGAYNQLLSSFDDLLGATLTYIRTFERYLNNQNGSERFSERTYDIKQKVSQDKTNVSFTLGTALTRGGMKIPARRATEDTIPGFGIKN